MYRRVILKASKGTFILVETPAYATLPINDDTLHRRRQRPRRCNGAAHSEGGQVSAADLRAADVEKVIAVCVGSERVQVSALGVAKLKRVQA